MWYEIFPRVLNMTLTAGIIVVFVLLARLPLKKAPKIFSYVLWAVVLFRLLCPVSISSPLSMFNLLDTPISSDGHIEYVPSNIVHRPDPAVALPFPGISDAINGVLPQGAEQTVADPLEFPMTMATYIWLAGIAVLTIYSITSLLRLRRKLVGAVRLRDNIYLADHIDSPFVVGLFRPKIYLPSTLPQSEQGYIILHEQTHIRRLDHIAKIISFLALTLHWFNPLVWVAFFCAMKDMEMSCDERVMKKMDRDIRREYSASLLSLATGRRIIAGTPLAFGEGDTKGRIKNVLKYKKPARILVAAAAIAVVILIAGLATNSSRLTAEKIEADARRTQTLQECELVAMDVSNGIGAMLFYDTQNERTCFSIYVNDGNLFENYVFRRGGSASEVDFGIARFEQGDVVVLMSANSFGVADIELESGEIIHVASDEPFVVNILAADAYGLRFFSESGEEIIEDEVKTTIEEAIGNVLTDRANTDGTNGDLSTYAYSLLGTQENGEQETAYLMVMYMDFGFSGGAFFETGGSHMPVALTFNKAGGEYELIENWMPQDGAYYPSSIQEKFPDDIEELALDTQLFVWQHTIACYKQAIVYGDVDTEYHIAWLIEAICSSPTAASNPAAYMEAHALEYREMVYYGEYTLNYCFALFEAGGGTGLEGHIMASACSDIMDALGMDRVEGAFDTGRDWYDAQGIS